MNINQLPKTLIPAVTLTVPEGALNEGVVETLYLAVLRDDRERPKLTGRLLLLL